MTTPALKSFKVHSKNKFLDYRLGGKLNLKDVKLFFQKEYKVENIWIGPRHILGILLKNEKRYFLKLATSEGISVVTQKEFEWNNYFNKFADKNEIYKVPKNYGSGYYRETYLYLITEYFKGDLLCPLTGSKKESENLVDYIDRIIDLSEIIQKLPQVKNGDEDFRVKFLRKTEDWFDDIPQDIKEKFQIRNLLQIVKDGVNLLNCKPRHGDLAPWHIIKLKDGSLGLIDGEHFLYNGVENYDICYFIQRVFSVLKNPEVAKEIFKQLINKGFNKNKLEVVLAARAIGGFLDEYLTDKPNYKVANELSEWVTETAL